MKFTFPFLKRNIFNRLRSPFWKYSTKIFCSGFISTRIHSHYKYPYVFPPHLTKGFWHISCTLHFLPVQTCFTFQAESSKTETEENVWLGKAWRKVGWRGRFSMGKDPQGHIGLVGNKLAQLFDIAHHFYLSCFRCVMNSTLDRPFLSSCTKKCIS